MLQGSSSNATEASSHGANKKCFCGLECRIWTCKQGENKGLQFYGCQLYKNASNKGCGFFAWVDDSRNSLMKLAKEVSMLGKKIEQIIFMLKILFVLLGILVFLRLF